MIDTWGILIGRHLETNMRLFYTDYSNKLDVNYIIYNNVNDIGKRSWICFQHIYFYKIADGLLLLLLSQYQCLVRKFLAISIANTFIIIMFVLSLLEISSVFVQRIRSPKILMIFCPTSLLFNLSRDFFGRMLVNCFFSFLFFLYCFLLLSLAPSTSASTNSFQGKSRSSRAT